MEFYKKQQYPDGDFYVEILNPVDSFTFRLNSFEYLWELNHIVDALNHLDIKPTILIPQLISSQADRRFGNDQSSGLKLVCKFLNGLDAKFKIFHPHNAEVVEALMDNVEIIDNSSFIQRVLLNIKGYGQPDESNLITLDNLILMSSDAGGFKPLMKLADKIKWQGETESASKSRKYEDGESKIVQKIDRHDFEGKDILIVDDICVKGGTFIGLAKMLRECNCGKLYLAVSHLTVEYPNPELFDYFDKVFTTNSKGLEYIIYNDVKVDKLKVINLF